MKNCILIYFTGTYNTRYISAKLRDRFSAAGWNVTTYEIDPLNNERLDLSGFELVGLGYPIHGYCAPWAFLRFVRAQKFLKGQKVFIYKNSGETEHANDASSKYLLRKLRRDGARTDNEYHFVMPYNIHFRFDDRLIREMLVMDDKLMDILFYEVISGIPNRKPMRLWPRLVSAVVSRPQYIGGDVNSFFYKVDMDRCLGCGLCIRRCPTKNIYRKKDGTIAFGHHCLMCMRCSFHCPADAIHIGFLEQWGWKVNGAYDFARISRMEPGPPVITEKTEGFFHCYIETFGNIDKRHKELFGE